jgi:hypothetical protein
MWSQAFSLQPEISKGEMSSMELIEAKALVQHAYVDEGLLALYDAGDKLSKSQTKHDVNHAYQVRDVALALTTELHRRNPELLDEWTREVIIPLAAYLHDIGRAISVNDHANAGAKWANKYLRDLKFPQEVVRRVCKIIACHRSSIVLSRKFDDPAWAIVVIADKCVGDEDRVRPGRAAALRVMRFFRLAHQWTGSIHDRINFAIKEAGLTVDGNEDRLTDAGAIVLKLRIDEHVSAPRDIYELYGDRFHACGRAAVYLGFLFRLEFNGVRYLYSEEDQTWLPVKSIKVL